MTNILRGIVTFGMYKGKTIEVKIGKSGNDTEIYIDDKLMMNIEYMTIRIQPNQPIKFHIEMFEETI